MKKQIIIVLALLFYGALQAQETGNYLSFDMGGGFHNLSYTLLDGTAKGQFGYTLNAGYSYFFTPQWGLHTGLGFQSFNSLSTLNYLSTTPDIDSEGQSYLFKANYKNWKENQQALFVDVPLSIQYRLPVNNKLRLMASVGGKISFPVDASFKTSGGEFITTGYYAKWNVEFSNMPQHGFSTNTNTYKGNTTIKPAYMAIGDIGGLYKLSEKFDLYVGGYLNYGLNNVLNPDNKLIYQSNDVYNGIFASNQTSSVTPISVGLKVGVYWHFGDKKSVLDFEKPAETTQQEQPAIPLKPIEPVQPVQAVQPAQPVQSVQPVLPVQGTEPVQPVKVTEPAEPVTVTASVAPALHVQVPAPVQPTQSVQPTKPVQTVQPAQPIVPVVPVIPVKPVDPVKTEAIVLENPVPAQTPKATEKALAVTQSVKETVAETPVKIVAKNDSIQTEDPFEKARLIAASMNLMFGFNSSEVTIAKNDMIKELSDILKANSFIHLRFVGHTCNIGTHEINMRLGLRRADNVKQKFIEQGVSRSQLVGESKAYDQPLVPNTSKANRARNRRVEIKVFK